MEAARTSETSVDNYFTRQYIPEDKSELHTRRRENLKSHEVGVTCSQCFMNRLLHLFWRCICQDLNCRRGGNETGKSQSLQECAEICYTLDYFVTGR